MKWHGNRVFWGIAVCAVLLAGKSNGQEVEPEAEVEIVRGEPIDSGYVILDGRYLPPPYALEKRGDDLWVNDQLATTDWFARPTGPMGPRERGEPRDRGHRGGPGGRGPRGGGRPSFEPRFRLTPIENTLKKNGMLVAGEGLHGSTFRESDAAAIVDILMSKGSHEEKLALILEYGHSGMDESSWQHLIAAFVPSDELMERMRPEIEFIQKVAQENEAQHKAALASVFWTSKPVKYVITLLAMGLVVAACGTLLNYRPIGRARWSELDATGDGVPIVVRSVALLILLGIFDLACTLVAQQAGGFTEMNPLGSRIVENPLLLTAFKLTFLSLACSILFALRRYRGAQVASWWMCLLCTVVTFRWLTYNSMFMG